MARSTTFKKTVHSVNAPEVPLTLLEINHSGLVTPVRVVNDMQDIVSGGNTYQALNFSISLPNQPETGQAEARLSIDNVGKTLMVWLEASAGGAGATCNLKQVLRSTPDVVEYEVDLFLTDIHVTPDIVSARLSFTDIYNKPALPTKYTSKTAIGLF